MTCHRHIGLIEAQDGKVAEEDGAEEGLADSTKPDRSRDLRPEADGLKRGKQVDEKFTDMRLMLRVVGAKLKQVTGAGKLQQAGPTYVCK